MTQPDLQSFNFRFDAYIKSKNRSGQGILKKEPVKVGDRIMSHTISENSSQDPAPVARRQQVWPRPAVRHELSFSSFERSNRGRSKLLSFDETISVTPGEKQTTGAASGVNLRPSLRQSKDYRLSKSHSRIRHGMRNLQAMKNRTLKSSTRVRAHKRITFEESAEQLGTQKTALTIETDKMNFAEDHSPGAKSKKVASLSNVRHKGVFNTVENEMG